MFRFSPSKCLPLNLFNSPTELLISVHAFLTALLHVFIFISIFKNVFGEGEISIYVPFTNKELHLRAMRQCVQDPVGVWGGWNGGVLKPPPMPLGLPPLAWAFWFGELKSSGQGG